MTTFVVEAMEIINIKFSHTWFVLVSLLVFIVNTSD